MDTIRWGILGAAKFARDHMGPAIHAARNAEFAAFASSDPVEKGRDFRALAPGVIGYSSYEELLADASIHAVYIPLPNDMHVPWALKALDAGKHVLVEKPVGMTVGEVDQLIAARDRSGLMAAEAFMIPHEPARILHADIHRDAGVDTHAEMVFDMGGFTFSAHTSMRASRWQEMVFHGASAVARMRAPFNPGVFAEAQIDVFSEDHSVRSYRWTDVNQYVLQVEAFGRAISGEAFACPLEFSRGTQVILDDLLG